MKKFILMLIVVALVVAIFSVSALAYSQSNTYDTTDVYHETLWDSSPYYFRNVYDWGGWVLPGDDCSVRGCAQTVSGKLAYVYVYLKDQDGETYSGTGSSSSGNLVNLLRKGDDDIAQKGTIKCRFYSGPSTSYSITDYMYMYVDDSGN